MPPFEVPITAEAVVQADIGGMSIAFTRVVVNDEIDPWLDTCRKAINRQRAQHELVEALVDIEARRDALRTAPEREREMLKARGVERARLVASWEASHSMSGARGDFKPNPAQRKGLIEFDEQTAREREKFDSDREKVEAEMPHYEARRDRALAIIAGKERAEVIGATEPLLHAAE